MAAISIETKKMTELDQVTSIGMDTLVLVHTASGMRVCTLKNLLDSGGASIPLATTAIAGIIKPDGTTITVKADGTASAVVPDPEVATAEKVGVVKPDGTTVIIKPDGTLSAKQKDATVATSAEAGIVKPDGTTITVQEDGTITAKQAEVATVNKAGLVKPDGTTVILGENGQISAKQAGIATTAAAGLVKPDGTTLSIGADGLLKVIGGGSSGGLDVAKNAGAHNSIFRGKNLGTAVTAAQYAAIRAGTFDDLFIGDYWVIGGVNYRIAAFDYYLHCGDTECTAHHVVIVPDTCLYNAAMNSSNVTTGGYQGSVMYSTNLAQAKTTIKAAFSGHVLKHRVYLVNAVSNGKASAGSWYDSEVDLMCEHMVYGSGIFNPVSDGNTVPSNYRVEKSQLPLFALAPEFICNRVSWWLRDVISAAFFAHVNGTGYASYTDASLSVGVRPAFCIS